MDKKFVTESGKKIAVIHSENCLLPDAQAALDLIATLHYDDNCRRLALPKEALPADFFELRTGLAGEILQKFTNYFFRLAIIGDFSGYASQPLQDFIRECNRGQSVFFVATEAQAIERLAK